MNPAAPVTRIDVGFMGGTIAEHAVFSYRAETARLTQKEYHLDLPGKPAPPPEAPFFTAAPWKLILMSLCTSGFYEFYWFFQNWKKYRKRTREFIYPGWRAVFSPIWAYSFFKLRSRQIRRRMQDQDAVRHPSVHRPPAYVLLFASHNI